MSFIDAFPEPPTPTSTGDRLNFIFDIIPAGLFDNAKKLWEPRLKVDGTEVQIMGTATPSETEEQIGWNLTVSLLKPSQYVAIYKQREHRFRVWPKDSRGLGRGHVCDNTYRG
jgi:hypothetical protein